MVILNITKIAAIVNVFQNANNFLLIINNLFERFLVIVTSTNRLLFPARLVKFYNFTNTRFSGKI